MIRTILFASAAMLAIPALAQQTDSTTGPADMNAPGMADTSVQTPADATSNAGPQDSGAADMATGTGSASPTRQDTTGAAGSSMTGMVPGMTATTSTGATGTSAGQGGPFEAAGRDYPACSRTVTDNCRQVPRRRPR